MKELLEFNGKYYNPLIVSRFVLEKAERYTYPKGWDPRKQKLIDALPWYKRIGRGKDSWAESIFFKPRVHILGANGKIIGTVTFSSNSKAVSAKLEMEKKLSDLLEKYQPRSCSCGPNK